MKRINYRKLAFEHYQDRLFCAHCGFGIPEVLEVAHLDCQRSSKWYDGVSREQLEAAEEVRSTTARGPSTASF
jgi:hypothetical protein